MILKMIVLSSEPCNPSVPGPNPKSALNTVDDVVAFGIGPGTEALHGSLENTIIFKIIRDEL